MINPAPFIDHTLLKATTTPSEIASLCEEAVEYGFAAVCIPPTFVSLAVDALYGSGVDVATVVGFPLGYETTAIKVLETQRAVAAGAAEIDMVINLGAAQAGDLDLVRQDIAAVVSASEEARVKVILECCLFDLKVKAALAEAAVTAGADYVKTSTGFSTGGATVEDVALLSEITEGRAKVKAAGGIRDWAACRAMIEAGADRIGTSAGLQIIQGWQAGESNDS